MLPNSGWLYFNSNSVWQSKFCLTIPNCVFEEYEILSRDHGGWWINDESTETIQISNKIVDNPPRISRYAELSDPGDESRTRFFTIPREFRVNHTPNSEIETVPESVSLGHGEQIHFLSSTSTVSDDPRTLYLFTLPQLEERIDNPDQWADDPKSIARLLDSEAKHLISEDGFEVQKEDFSDLNGRKSPQSLEARLNIDQGDVPDEFRMRYATVEIEDIPKEVYSNTDLNYLLVRYGISGDDNQNSAKDPEVMDVINKVVNVDTSYRSADQTIEASVPFCIHDSLAAEFKFFVDVADADLVDMVKSTFDNSSSCNSASITDSLNDRVYMVHSEFPTKETPDGFINNVLYPK